ncbi:MAG: hypothetical protein JWS12_25 [Candidatus Saccharibacteria bacterium]|nr:hypothetical protein [Candidatus Saccharibacteria bacterium]
MYFNIICSIRAYNRLTMYFYEVGVASREFHGQEPLTYNASLQLPIGSVVAVPLRKSVAIGITLKGVPRPKFPTKAIIKQLTPLALPKQSIELLAWLSTYYPSPLNAHTQLFIPGALLRKPRETAEPTEKSPATQLPQLPPLTQEQQQTVRAIEDGPVGSYLVHGETGSGKTRVYIELARQTIRRGQSVFVLTPEISLTPQLAKSFQRVFGRQVIVAHSNLSDTERRQLWLRTIASPEPLILIGPRSILFYPLHGLGLIVIDEAHEGAYKQEQAPYYHAVRVAAKLASLHQAKLVIGSATPSVDDYFIAQQRGLPILRMTKLAMGDHSQPPGIEVVDMRDGNNLSKLPYLSNQLMGAIEMALRNQEQILLFLNRRGSARLILCHSCGWQSLCPRCDIPLTYHGDSHTTRCHTCGWTNQAPVQCPVCHSLEIIFKSVGTKSLADEIERLFPKAKVMRFDTDNLKAERFETHYHDIREGKIDILVGTQMLTKGLDLPRLSLVGIVAADSSLHFPDFSAEERTYQLLSQVLGRVGRGHRAGQAILQTYTPDNPTIQAAVHRNWEEFYATQLKERQQFGFPPFRYLLQLTNRRASKLGAQKAADKLKAQLAELKLPIEIIGPSPAFYEKINNKYQWQLVIKTKNRSYLLEVIKKLPPNWTYNIDPVNLL